MQTEAQQIRALLSKEEWQGLHRKSDLRAAWTVVFNWLFVAACFALVAAVPHVLTVLVALVLLGGRQLGLAVLMHDAGHRAMFRSPTANLWVGRWLCGAPTFSDLDSYSKKHLKHHLKAGTHEDPDLGNYRNYAVSKWSFRRKILRDLTGWTGTRTLINIARYGGLSYLWRPLIANAVLFGIFLALGRPLLYLLWLGAWFTTNMLFSRLRQAAEHAVTPDLYDPDPRLHTRTTIARWWERLTLAPNGVNFHLEHHLLPSVPPYRLPSLHRMLQERGFYEQAEIANGYREVVAKLTVKQPAEEPAEAAG